MDFLKSENSGRTWVFNKLKLERFLFIANICFNFLQNILSQKNGVWSSFNLFLVILKWLNKMAAWSATISPAIFHIASWNFSRSLGNFSSFSCAAWTACAAESTFLRIQICSKSASVHTNMWLRMTLTTCGLSAYRNEANLRKQTCD